MYTNPSLQKGPRSSEAIEIKVETAHEPGLK